MPAVVVLATVAASGRQLDLRPARSPMSLSFRTSATRELFPPPPAAACCCSDQGTTAGYRGRVDGRSDGGGAGRPEEDEPGSPVPGATGPGATGPGSTGPGSRGHGGTEPVGAAAPVVRLVVAGLAVEVLVLAAVAVLYLLGTGRGEATSAGLAVGSAALALALAGLLGGSAVGMARGRRRGRAPALVWQVLQLLVAAQVVLEEASGTSTWWAALGVAALAAVVGLALASGAATRALPLAPDGDEPLL